MQLRTKVRVALAGLAITGGAAAAVVLGSAGPALGFFSPPLLLEIHVNSPATLIAKGASADVSVQIECAGARTAFVSVSLTERAGSEIATGFGSDRNRMHEREPNCIHDRDRAIRQSIQERHRERGRVHLRMYPQLPGLRKRARPTHHRSRPLRGCRAPSRTGGGAVT
jgi:hypothetical protein